MHPEAVRWWALLFLWAGCEEAPGLNEDAGFLQGSDVGMVVDAAAEEAGVDAGFADAEVMDAAVPEAGMPDMGAPDAGGPEACEVAGVVSECTDVTECAGYGFRSVCDGAPRNVCCQDETPCSVSGAPGLCLDVADCAGVSTPGRCPGAANIQCCTLPGTACDEAAAPSPNQGLVEVSHDATCPDGMVLAGAFCIDRYEAALVEVGGDHHSPYVNPGTKVVRAVSIAYAVPQGYVSGQQAADACAAAGKRLCTDAEWLAACRGAASSTYPYGDTREDGRCNDARGRHPAVEYFGSSEQWVFSELDNRCINQIPASVALTGQYAGCESPVGALDMMGNLHEWTADPSGTFRGGFYTDTRMNGEGCLYATTAHTTPYWDYSTGFRCCADP